MTAQDIKYRLLLTVAVVLLTISVSSPGNAANLNIVTTTTDLASITRAITGDRAVVSSIATGKEDPHFISVKPSFIMKARKADLWIRIGMDLEIGWEGPVIRGSRNYRIREGESGHLDVSADILRLDLPSRRLTRAMGDVHPAGNPHYWLDPLNGRLIAEAITRRLQKLVPEDARIFKQNLQGFTYRLDSKMFGRDLVDRIGGDTLWALVLNEKLNDYLKEKGVADKLGGWLAKMDPHRGRKIVTHHRSWVYLAHRFKLEIPLELEPKPGIPPSPAHLARVVQTMEEQEIKVILLEPFYSRKSADLAARRTGARVLVRPNTVAGGKETGGYPAMIGQVVEGLSSLLEETAE